MVQIKSVFHQIFQISGKISHFKAQKQAFKSLQMSISSEDPPQRYLIPAG